MHPTKPVEFALCEGLLEHLSPCGVSSGQIDHSSSRGEHKPCASDAQVANRFCEGRIVSALEGGYRIQGKIVSAFARSVAAHVRALSEPNFQVSLQ